MKTLYVYTRPACSGCAAVKKFLDEMSIPYVEVDVDTNSAARHRLTAVGHRSVPQLYADDALLVRGGWNSVKSMRRDEILDRLK
jgi:glutaredoxin